MDSPNQQYVGSQRSDWFEFKNCLQELIMATAPISVGVFVDVAIFFLLKSGKWCVKSGWPKIPLAPF